MKISNSAVGNLSKGLLKEVGTSHRKMAVSMIYFIHEGGMGAIKIGSASHVQSRFNNIQVCTPHELKLLAVIEGGRSEERSLHQRFAHAHIRGEWFRPVPELLEYIANVRKKSA